MLVENKTGHVNTAFGTQAEDLVKERIAFWVTCLKILCRIYFHKYFHFLSISIMKDNQVFISAVLYPCLPRKWYLAKQINDQLAESAPSSTAVITVEKKLKQLDKRPTRKQPQTLMLLLEEGEGEKRPFRGWHLGGDAAKNTKEMDTCASSMADPQVTSSKTGNKKLFGTKASWTRDTLFQLRAPGKK